MRGSEPLGGLPVVLALDPRMERFVFAGAERAGRGVTVGRLNEADERMLLEAARSGIGMAVMQVDEDPLDTLRSIARLGGRPIPALDVDLSEGAGVPGPVCRALLQHPGLQDVNVPVPSLDVQEARRAFWNALRAVDLHVRCHLVEVDGRPALETSGDQGVDALAAGAAGVLAARLAVGDRRWQMGSHEDEVAVSRWRA